MAKSNFGEETGVSLLKRERMTSFSEGLVPVAMSQMSCLTQLAGSAAAMVVKMASFSSADLFLRLCWLKWRRAAAFKRIAAPATAATGATAPAVPPAKRTWVPPVPVIKAPVPVTIDEPKIALVDPMQAKATAEISTAGFISKKFKSVYESKTKY